MRFFVAIGSVGRRRLRNNAFAGESSAIEVAAVLIVSGAGAFGRDHGCAERALGGALLAERRTIGRLARTAQNQAADAGFGFARRDRFNLENSLGVMFAILLAKLIAGIRNRADSAPLAGGNLEHFRNQVDCRPIAVARNRTHILILYFGPAIDL